MFRKKLWPNAPARAYFSKKEEAKASSILFGIYYTFLHNATLTPDEVKQNVLHFHRNIYGAGLWEKSALT